ncbi:hypothetical protein PN36_10795 [Candidatus Thiomargarita nelsonii]|uniref:Uncharacterized protein n=1 Tax=Candidatus Thiomargarita nelsonii TaxID=1003181 RepID=A0A0A6S4R2_9GAMM|nr:hypothetical protein PN36_10795 [Candidatus Thiomargarita nelsonii]
MLTPIHKLIEIEHLLNKSKKDNSKLLDYRITLRLNLDIDISILLKERDSTILSELERKLKNQKVHLDTITLSDCKTDEFYDYLFSQEKNPNLINLLNKRRYDYLADYENT